MLATNHPGFITGNIVLPETRGRVNLKKEDYNLT
jgi:hypothetical protein